MLLLLAGLVWLWWRNRGNSLPGSFSFGSVGGTTTYDNTGGAVDAIASLFGGPAPGRRVQLNTPHLNLQVADPAGEFQALVEAHCTADPGDGFCREPGTTNVLNKYSYNRP